MPSSSSILTSSSVTSPWSNSYTRRSSVKTSEYPFVSLVSLYQNSIFSKNEIQTQTHALLHKLRMCGYWLKYGIGLVRFADSRNMNDWWRRNGLGFVMDWLCSVAHGLLRESMTIKLWIIVHTSSPRSAILRVWYLC